MNAYRTYNHVQLSKAKPASILRLLRGWLNGTLREWKLRKTICNYCRSFIKRGWGCHFDFRGHKTPCSITFKTGWAGLLTRSKIVPKAKPKPQCLRANVNIFGFLMVRRRIS